MNPRQHLVSDLILPYALHYLDVHVQLLRARTHTHTHTHTPKHTPKHTSTTGELRAGMLPIRSSPFRTLPQSRCTRGHSLKAMDSRPQDTGLGALESIYLSDHPLNAGLGILGTD